MTTFVTGGTSRFGRIFVKEFARRGESMRILVRQNSDRRGLELPGVEFVRGDLLDPVTVRKGITGCDQVCHLAALTQGQRDSPTEQWRVNEEGTHNVLKAAVDLAVRSVVQVSPLAVLGPTKRDEIADEERPIDPRRFTMRFQKTRHAADQIALEYAERGLPVKLVHPGYGYGRAWFMGKMGYIEQLLLHGVQNRPLTLVGRPQRWLCYVHYADVVEGIVLAHTHGQTGERYILGGEALTSAEVWDTIGDLVAGRGSDPGFDGAQDKLADDDAPNVAVSQRHVPRWIALASARMNRWMRGDSDYSLEFLHLLARDWRFSSEKAQLELGWRPRSFQDGVAATWSEYQAFGWQSKARAPQRVMRGV